MCSLMKVRVCDADTNDAYAVIQLGRDKYQTSIKERSRDPEWNEECTLSVHSIYSTNLVFSVIISYIKCYCFCVLCESIIFVS